MSDTPPSAETLREVVKRYRQPIYVRISEDDLTAFCAEISAGINTVGGAAARLGVDSSTIRRTMQAGAAAAALVADGKPLCKEEQRALWFYDSVLKAQGSRQRALTLRALGIGPKGGSNKESRAALEILRLTCAEYREPPPPVPVPDEKPPTPAAPTPEQIISLAASAGLRILPADPAAMDAEVRAYLAARGLVIATPGDTYDAGTS